MNELNDLMQNEYEAMAGMGAPLPQLLGEALKIVRAKITDEEYLEIEIICIPVTTMLKSSALSKVSCAVSW